MKEPRRLADDPADPAGVLLSSAREQRPPRGARERAALALGVGMTGAAIPSGSAAAAGSSGSAAAAVGGAGSLKVGGLALAVSAAVLVSAVVGGVVSFVAFGDDSSDVASAPPPVPVKPAQTGDVRPNLEPEPEVARGNPPDAKPKAASEPVVQRAPAARSVRDDLHAELRRIDEARAATPEQAVALIARYRRDFPRGALGYEASLVEIDALERGGQHERAVKSARRLLERHPKGPATNRLRVLVGASDATPR